MAKKTKKLWGGRFGKATAEKVDRFQASVGFDRRLYPFDIQGSKAHAKMLARQGIISQSDFKKIERGLKKIHQDIDVGKFRWDPSKEDVHLNIEAKLIQLIGETGGKLHTARSRNDQVTTDLRLYCREKINHLTELLRAFQKALVQLAKKHVDTLLPGYTHMQRAQPISLAHYLLAYFEMAQRDRERLKDALNRVNCLPLGSGALAGTTFPVDRRFTAKELKFSSISRNSLDAVSDRDFAIEILSHLALIMMHLSRLSEEWIMWTTQEFQFIHLPEEFCTGSSMMPQKMNPDVLELIRGKTGRVYGALISLLVVMKGLPLAYNKDMQEDKEPLFDAIDTTAGCLEILTSMIQKTDFNAKKMKAALASGFVLATDLADYLVTKGVPFRKAHEMVGKLVADCQRKKVELGDLTLQELKKLDKHFDKDVFQWLHYSHAVDRRSSQGGTSRKRIKLEIQKALQFIRNP